jgi:hypothetical protein
VGFGGVLCRIEDSDLLTDVGAARFKKIDLFIFLNRVAPSSPTVRDARPKRQSDRTHSKRGSKK